MLHLCLAMFRDHLHTGLDMLADETVHGLYYSYVAHNLLGSGGRETLVKTIDHIKSKLGLW